MERTRVVIRRGIHRNEAVAFYLAPKVSQYLQQMGYSCVLETKPLLATTWGEMLKGRKERFDFRAEGDLYISFHDAPDYLGMGMYFVDQKRRGGNRSIAVDIQAIYRKITNPSILERVKKWVDGNSQRRNYAEDWGYMRGVSDVKSSIAAGLVGNETVEKIVERIIEFIAGDNL